MGLIALKEPAVLFILIMKTPPPSSPPLLPMFVAYAFRIEENNLYITFENKKLRFWGWSTMKSDIKHAYIETVLDNAQESSDEYTKWPDVWLAAEFAVSDDLRGRPLYRKLGAQWACVLIIENKSKEQKKKVPSGQTLLFRVPLK